MNGGLTPRLFTYGLNRARRMHGEMNLMTQGPKFEPVRSEVDHATFRSRKVITILNLHMFFFLGGGRTHKLGVTGIWRNPHTRALVQHLDKRLFRCSVSGKLDSEMFLFHFTKVFEIGLNLSSK